MAPRKLLIIYIISRKLHICVVVNRVYRYTRIKMCLFSCVLCASKKIQEACMFANSMYRYLYIYIYIILYTYTYIDTGLHKYTHMGPAHGSSCEGSSFWEDVRETNRTLLKAPRHDRCGGLAFAVAFYPVVMVVGDDYWFMNHVPTTINNDYEWFMMVDHWSVFHDSHSRT